MGKADSQELYSFHCLKRELLSYCWQVFLDFQDRRHKLSSEESLRFVLDRRKVLEKEDRR